VQRERETEIAQFARIPCQCAHQGSCKLCLLRRGRFLRRERQRVNDKEVYPGMGFSEVALRAELRLLILRLLQLETKRACSTKLLFNSIFIRDVAQPYLAHPHLILTPTLACFPLTHIPLTPRSLPAHTLTLTHIPSPSPSVSPRTRLLQRRERPPAPRSRTDPTRSAPPGRIAKP
jgi:hypothetical protein